MDADHGCLRDRGMSDREVFQIDRGNPLAAGLDHILGAIGDPHVSVLVDGRDVAGVEITFLVENVGIDVEIGLRYRGTADLQPAEGLAVPRQFLTGIVGDLHLNAERRIALGLENIKPGVAGEFVKRGFQRGKGANRAHLGHAPGVAHLNPHVQKRLDHCARHRRAAADHHSQMRQLQLVGGDMIEQHQPHRRNACGMRHFLAFQQLEHRRTIEFRAGEYQLGAHRGRRESDAPAVGMEQRNHRQHCILGVCAQRIAGVGHQRMQDVGAMRIQYALGVACGAGGVAHRGRGIFIERLPLEVSVGLRDPVFIGDRVLQRGLRHMRLVGEYDVAFHARQLVGDLFQDRHKGEIGHHHAVFRMVDDPGDLVGEQPRIDGMADRADAHDAVPGFKMAPGIPGDSGDAVAELDTVAVEALRDLQRAIANFGVICAMDRAFDRSRYDLLRSMYSGRMLDNPVTKQRPVLHQSKHTNVPPGGVTACRRSSRNCHEL